jgi:hypothetical protein
MPNCIPDRIPGSLSLRVVLGACSEMENGLVILKVLSFFSNRLLVRTG